MNVVNSITNNACKQQRITKNDFHLGIPGQHGVPDIRTSQSQFIQTQTDNGSKNVIGVTNNCIVHSRMVCRSDLIGYNSRFNEMNLVHAATENGLEGIPSSSSTSSQSVSYVMNGQKSSATMINDSSNNFVPEYNISKRLEDFVFNSTLRGLTKHPSFVTATSVSPVLGGSRKISRNPPVTNKPNNKSEVNSNVVLVLTEGRGSAQGEIGLATIDLKRPVLIVCQICDTQTYVNTMHKINILNPGEILVPHAFMDQMQGSFLYNMIKSQFPCINMLTTSRKHFCENEAKLYLKNSILLECTSTLEQVMSKFYAASAAAALLKHIEFNYNMIFSAHTLKIEYEGIEKSMFVDTNTALRLELVSSSSLNTISTLYEVLNHCTTVGGQRRLRYSILQPSCDIQLIHNRQEAVEEMLSYQKPNFMLLKSVIQKFVDVEKLYWLCTKVPKNTQHASKLKGNYTLLLKTTLEALPALVDILEPFKSEYIFGIRKTLSSSGYSKMLEIINVTVNKESTRTKGYSQSQFQRCFAIKSNLNPSLDVFRTIYSELIEDFRERVKVLEKQLSIGILSVKNSSKRGFYVEVELKNIKNFNVKHLPSVCKNVECFKNIVKFTTEDLLTLNMRIFQALKEVEYFTNTMLFEMLNELRKYISHIHDLCTSIADLDLIISFAVYSMRSGLTRPKFGQNMNIKNSRHPILDFINSTVPVENDIFSSTDKNLSIITGPNMGGKTIYIRQVALLQIMAQIGCFVPATEAQFRICDRLFSRIGFEDNMESNASTWVLEIKELNNIIHSLTNHSLVIIDELCRATSCEEGSSLAWATCEHLMQSCAFVFFATHNILVTKLQDLYCNVINYHMESILPSDNTSGLCYTYKLRPGVMNIHEYGLILAREVKMPEHLIEHAIEIEKRLRQTKTMPNYPSNEPDLILDSCVQKLLNMKDNESIDLSNIKLVVSEMMVELEENMRNNSNSFTEFIDSDDESSSEITTNNISFN